MRFELHEEQQLFDLDPQLAQRGRDFADHRCDESVIERPHLRDVDFRHAA
jgi:hypothetical protein